MIRVVLETGVQAVKVEYSLLQILLKRVLYPRNPTSAAVGLCLSTDNFPKTRRATSTSPEHVISMDDLIHTLMYSDVSGSCIYAVLGPLKMECLKAFTHAQQTISTSITTTAGLGSRG